VVFVVHNRRGWYGLLKKTLKERGWKAKAQTALEYLMLVAAIIGLITLLAYVFKTRIFE